MSDNFLKMVMSPQYRGFFNRCVMSDANEISLHKVITDIANDTVKRKFENAQVRIDLNRRGQMILTIHGDHYEKLLEAEIGDNSWLEDVWHDMYDCNQAYDLANQFQRWANKIREWEKSLEDEDG